MAEMCLVVILDGEESEKYRGLSLLVSGLCCCLVGNVGIGSCPLQSASPPRYPGSRVMAASMRDQEHSATTE